MKLLLLLFLLLPLASHGSSCLSPRFDVEAARLASQVIVFRLEGIEIDPDAMPGWRNYQAVGRVVVVEVLKGAATQFKTVRFNSSPSCGTGMDVGHYYLAFTSSGGESFAGSEANLSNITEPYDGFASETWSEKGVLRHVSKFINGQVELDQRVPSHAHDWLCQDPPPPPPICPTNSAPET